MRGEVHFELKIVFLTTVGRVFEYDHTSDMMHEESKLKLLELSGVHVHAPY